MDLFRARRSRWKIRIYDLYCATLAWAALGILYKREREKARKLMGSRGERRGGGLKKYGKNQHFAVDDVAPVCQCHVVYVRHLVLSVSHWPFVKVA